MYQLLFAYDFQYMLNLILNVDWIEKNRLWKLTDSKDVYNPQSFFDLLLMKYMKFTQNKLDKMNIRRLDRIIRFIIKK